MADRKVGSNGSKETEEEIQEDEQTDESAMTVFEEAFSETTKRPSAYRGLKRELTSDELDSSGTKKLLLNDIDRLESELDITRRSNRQYRDNYDQLLTKCHESDKNLAVLQERIRHAGSLQIRESAFLAIGGVLAGAAFSVYDESHIQAYLVAFVGIGLISAVFLLRPKD